MQNGRKNPKRESVPQKFFRSYYIIITSSSQNYMNNKADNLKKMLQQWTSSYHVYMYKEMNIS